MPSVYDLKPRFQALLRPVVRGLATAGVTANQVTVGAALLSGAAGADVALAPTTRLPLLLYPPVLFVRMALNAIDGLLAREHGQQSRLGGILNELGDMLADAALYLPLALVPGFHPGLQAVFVVLAVATEGAGLAAVAIGAPRRYDGPLGKSDRALAGGALALAAGLGLPLAPWLPWAQSALVALAAATIVQRSRRALAHRPPP